MKHTVDEYLMKRQLFKQSCCNAQLENKKKQFLLNAIEFMPKVGAKKISVNIEYSIQKWWKENQWKRNEYFLWERKHVFKAEKNNKISFKYYSVFQGFS